MVTQGRHGPYRWPGETQWRVATCKAGPRDAPFDTQDESAHLMVEADLGAADVDLTADDLCGIDAALANFRVEGERLPEAVLKMTGLQG